jgi:hypothetical protein
MGLVDVLLVDEHGGLHASPALAPRLNLVNNAQPLHILTHGTTA